MMNFNADDRQKYVLGFLFNSARTKVALIRKQKPSWQNGYLNGIGGKVEDNESILFAMKREFLEETGVSSEAWNWEEFAAMNGSEWKVHCFKWVDDDAINAVTTKTAEEVVVVFVADLARHKTLSNVPWLVHMALDENMGNPPFFAAIQY